MSHYVPRTGCLVCHRDEALEKDPHPVFARVCWNCWLGLTALRKDARTTRTMALIILGGVCNWCGFRDHRALQIDHVHGGGTTERRKQKVGGRTIYKRILDGNVEDYQVLCANCNWIKRDVEDEVPATAARRQRIEKEIEALQEELGR